MGESVERSDQCGNDLRNDQFRSRYRTNVDIAGVFAALLVIIAIGIVVEYGVFHTIEKMTLKKWGMSR